MSGKGGPSNLAEAVALGIEPKYPDILDLYPGYVLYDQVSGESLTLDPEDYRWSEAETAEEVRSSMEIAIETAWLESLEADEDRPAVLVPAWFVL